MFCLQGLQFFMLAHHIYRDHITLDMCESGHGFDNSAVKQYVLLTGSPALYTGPSYISGPYYTGHVRVRAWIALDLPLPVFTTSMAMGGKLIVVLLILE